MMRLRRHRTGEVLLMAEGLEAVGLREFRELCAGI